MHASSNTFSTINEIINEISLFNCKLAMKNEEGVWKHNFLFFKMILKVKIVKINLLGFIRYLKGC